MLTPIEYECDDPATIRRCPEHKFPWGVAPLYWYVRRSILTMDAKEIGWTREKILAFKACGYDTAYWTGERWQLSSPKQYATAEEAYQDFHAAKSVEPAAGRDEG